MLQLFIMRIRPVSQDFIHFMIFVDTGPSYMKDRLGVVYTGLALHGTTMGPSTYKNLPSLYYLPNFSKPEQKPSSYYSMITLAHFSLQGYD